MKNDSETGIFEELTPTSIENGVAGLGMSKMTSEDMKKEDNTYENVKKVEIEERTAEDKQQEKGAEGDVSKKVLEEESEHDRKGNASKQKKGSKNSQKYKITSFETNANLPFNIAPQCKTIGDGVGVQNVHKDAVPNIAMAGEGTTYQLNSLEGAKENNGISVIIDNEEEEDDNKGKQKETERLKDDKTKTKNLDMNISAGKKEKEGKNQPVLSTLAVPSTKHGHDSRGKELPIFESPGITEVKITVEQEEESCNNDKNGDREISSKDLFCFAWQIAQGMVSKLCNEGDSCDKHNENLCVNISFPHFTPTLSHIRFLCCPPCSC